MKLRNLIIIAIVLLLVSACSEKTAYCPPEFEMERRLDFEILSDRLMFFPYSLNECEGYLVATGHSSSGGETCFIYDKEGNLVYLSIKQGRGPAEVSGYSRVSSYDGVIAYYDIMAKEKLSFRLSEMLEKGPGSATKEQIDVPAWCTFYYDSPNGNNIAIISRSPQNHELPQRSILYKSDNGITYEHNGAVYEDRDVSWYASMQPHAAFSPDGKRMVISQNVGMVLEFYSLEDSIRLESTRRYYEPKITVNEYGYHKDPNTTYYTEGMKATEEQIFAIYDGEIPVSDINGKKNTLLFKNIASFDWNGNPLILYRTCYRVCKFCISGRILYAILQDPEGNYLLGKAGLD